MNAEITFEVEDTRYVGTWKLHHNDLMYGNKVSLPAESDEDLFVMLLLAENLTDSIAEIIKQGAE